MKKPMRSVKTIVLFRRWRRRRDEAELPHRPNSLLTVPNTKRIDATLILANQQVSIIRTKSSRHYGGAECSHVFNMGTLGSHIRIPDLHDTVRGAGVQASARCTPRQEAYACVGNLAWAIMVENV